MTGRLNCHQSFESKHENFDHALLPVAHVA